jgi:hypothetical protein
LGENNLEKVQKPSDKYHLEINATCIRIPIWRSLMPSDDILHFAH